MSSRIEVNITTFDNPFDVFTDFLNWFNYDVTKGYNTSEYLGRIARISESLTDEENNSIINDAIDEIIKYDIFNVYKKVQRVIDD